MYHQRLIDLNLLDWFRNPDRKPLILKGARQTGKSTTIRELGRQAPLFIELNFDRREDLALAQACDSPDEFLMSLATRHNLASFPDNTLLFLDEIQECARLVPWLRFFREDRPALAVIAAGSLLEVRFQDRGFSFPVGRVTFRTLYPFTYLEFLKALGHEELVKKLTAALLELKPIPKPLHNDALDAFRDYLLIGGMPEAVSSWVEHRRPHAIREIHSDLLQAFSEDFQKYRGVRDLGHLEAAFNNIRHHAGTRFKYENFAPGHRSQAMKTALGRLESALLISRVQPTSSLKPPLRSRPKSAPKLLPLDTGLTLSEMGLAPQDLKQLPLNRLLDGPLAEMFVGQQLNAGRSGKSETLHFWIRESSRGSAEVDYLLPGPGTLLPVEVKSGASGTLKSLHLFLQQAGLSTGVRLYSGCLADQKLEVSMPDGVLRYRLLSVPIYMAQALWDLAPRILDREIL